MNQRLALMGILGVFLALSAQAQIASAEGEEALPEELLAASEVYEASEAEEPAVADEPVLDEPIHETVAESLLEAPVEPELPTGEALQQLDQDISEQTRLLDVAQTDVERTMIQNYLQLLQQERSALTGVVH